MKAIVFGATGMVGQGALRECLLDGDVTEVLTVGRKKTGQEHPKLKELEAPDLYDLSPFAERLTGWDACLFCLGVSSFRMSEPDYRRVTYDLTLAVAKRFAEWNPQMTFMYVSGAHTDGTGAGSVMWARVKGQTENDIAKLPFKATYAFRPGAIQALHGIRPKDSLYRALYPVARPIFWLLRNTAPNLLTTTEELGRAMVNAGKFGAPKPVIEVSDIHLLAAAVPPAPERANQAADK